MKAPAGDLVASHRVVLPEGMVRYVEDGGRPPSMMAGAPASPRIPQGLLRTAVAGTRRELYWFKGLKLEVLDEQDRVLPTAEFICHFNLDVDVEFRNRVFPDAERCTNSRLVSISQGCTTVFLPEGCAVPVASDEPWQFSFQAANRTSADHRRVKHVCTIYLVKDSDLVQPVTPIHWKVPFITVIVDRDSPEAAIEEKSACPGCLGISRGVNAPNNVIGGVTEEPDGRIHTGHWVVPPGVHTYAAPVAPREPDFAERKRRIHAAWVHIHPMCREFSLVLAEPGARRRIYTAGVKTRFHDGGFEIDHIDFLSSREGIEIPAGGPYELEVTYDNTTAEPSDSMASTGIYLEDEIFRRPRWALFDADAASCGIGGMTGSAGEGGKRPLPPYPLFDPSRDGPLLDRDTGIELSTSAGVLHLVVEPGLAPVHATQVLRLVRAGA